MEWQKTRPEQNVVFFIKYEGLKQSPNQGKVGHGGFCAPEKQVWFW